MADIFISYSKSDRDKVVRLAAYLESEGWTVWWDTHLAAGDPYRDEIMTQLGKARAVIVLWTANSIKSDFVRAEAGQAKAQTKLIPVKENDVAYGDIPLPFGEMHTEELFKRELIRAAIIAQLARPHIQQGEWWIAKHTLRSELLTWTAIIGGVVTVFSNLQGVLRLSSFIEWLVTKWRGWSVMFWQAAFDLIGVAVPSGIVPFLSFALFAVTMGLGVRIKLGPPDLEWKNPKSEDILRVKMMGAAALFWLLLQGMASIYLGTIKNILYNPSPILFLILPSLYWRTLFLPRKDIRQGEKSSDDDEGIYLSLLLYIGLFAIFAFLLIGPRLLFLDFWHIVNPTEETSALMELTSGVDPFSLIILVACVLLLIAPLRGLVKRLMFLAIGVGVLAAMNQLALYAPHIRSLLKMA